MATQLTFLDRLLTTDPQPAAHVGKIVRVVSVSGGKDSTASALLALERHGHADVRLVFADTGNEHELTIEYVTGYLPRVLDHPIEVVRAEFASQIAHKREYVLTHWLEKGVPQDAVDRAVAALVPTGNPYLDLCLWKGRFPSRRAQFCTQELKRYPIDNFLFDLIAEHRGDTVESWQGVRADESASRAHLAEREDTPEGWVIYRPVLTWSAQGSVDYVRSKGVELNPLYTRGFARVGCAPCINNSKADITQWDQTFPEEIARIAEWEQRVAQASKRGESSFFTASEDGRGELRGRNVHAVVEWAKTSHGGRQFNIFSDLLREEGCSSFYGLCE